MPEVSSEERVMEEGQKPERRRKSRRERFLSVAERRTNQVLKAIRLLGNCGNRAAYEYTDEDVEKVFDAIQKEISNTRARFRIRSKDKGFRWGSSDGRR